MNRTGERNSGNKIVHPEDKNREMALYYNIAVDRMESFINYLTGNDSRYWKAIKDDSQSIEDYFKGTVNKSKLKLPAYAYLKSYFFYSSPLGKNEKISVSKSEKKFIILMLRCLNNFRNWHSHVCHRELVLVFFNQNKEEGILFDELKKYITEHFEKAVEKCTEDNYRLKDYFDKKLRPVITLFGQNQKITVYGRLFFLSFFLTRSEMSRLLGTLKGFHKQDTPEMKLKLDIFRVFAQRDGNSILNIIMKAWHGEESKQLLKIREELSRFSRFNEIIEYLRKKPAELCTDGEIEEFRNTPRKKRGSDDNSDDESIRIKKKFLRYAVDFLVDFADAYGLKNIVEWRLEGVNTFEEYESNKKKQTLRGKEYNVVLGKKVQEYGSSTEKRNKAYIRQGMVHFRYKMKNDEYVNCCMNEESVLYLLAAILLNYNTPEKIAANMAGYIIQYKSIIDKIRKNEPVNISNYPFINPEFLHNILQTVISGTEDSVKIDGYKAEIAKRFQNILSDIESLAEGSEDEIKYNLSKMRRADKNKLLLSWYNYVLSMANKFTAHKIRERGGLSEINNLSRFHYQPVNATGEKRIKLIEWFTHKLPERFRDVLLNPEYKDLDSLILAMKPLMADQFKFWNKIIKKEKFPPDWLDGDKDPAELLKIKEEQWAPLQLDQWHDLARKVNISNPFTGNTSRADKAIKRKDELNNFFSNIPVQFPKQIFVPQDKIQSVISLNYEKQGKGIKEVKSLAKQIRESDLANALINRFYQITVDEAIKLAEQKESGSKNSRQLIKEVLYNKTTDVLLWAIALEYHKKLKGAAFENKISYSNATVNSLHDETLTVELVKNKPLVIKQKQVSKLLYDFKLPDVKKIIENGLAEENTIDAIGLVLHRNYLHSLDYIERVFDLESCIIGTDWRDIIGDRCKDWERQNLSGNPKSYIRFDILLEKTPGIKKEDVDKLYKLRKSALHTHIPDGGSYEEGINFIEEYLGKKNFPFRDWKRNKQTDDDDDD